ncbi:MAG: hypothetical protein HC868_02560 [Sphingomonadales bacterium]|nr:hypothetical protein [Sphingomonadales bacterium]
MVQPDHAGQACTQVCYLAVPDVDAHYRRAAIAGATIELAPGSDGLGGDFYTCRDLEGHLWSFGTRDYRVGPRFASRLGAGSRRASQLVSVMAMVAVAAGAWAFHPGSASDARSVVTTAAAATERSENGGQVLHQLRRTTAERDSVREENARLAAEIALVRSHERLQRAIREQTGGEMAVLQEHLAREREARDAAVAEATRSAQELKALRADVEQQKQQRAVLQEQLQTTMAALVDARREAVPAAAQTSSVRTDTVAPPRAQRAIRARPAEAIACYRRVMRGDINWGGGTAWLPENAQALCSGTHNARRTIGCFEAGVRAGRPWRDVLAACRTT